MILFFVVSNGFLFYFIADEIDWLHVMEDTTSLLRTKKKMGSFRIDPVKPS